MKNVVLHTTYCRQCILLEKLLDKEEIDYQEKECNADELTEKGFLSAPVLQVGEKFLTYDEAVRWVYKERRG